MTEGRMGDRKEVRKRERGRGRARVEGDRKGSKHPLGIIERAPGDQQGIRKRGSESSTDNPSYHSS